MKVENLSDLRLLLRVAETGTLTAAAKALGMSYRRAWLLIDEINRMFREPSVITRHGGKAGGGAELTAFGADLLARCQRMEAAARAAIDSDLAYLAGMLSSPDETR